METVIVQICEIHEDEDDVTINTLTGEAECARGARWVILGRELLEILLGLED